MGRRKTQHVENFVGMGEEKHNTLENFAGMEKMYTARRSSPTWGNGGTQTRILDIEYACRYGSEY
jgi:hypothetical protein